MVQIQQSSLSWTLKHSAGIFILVTQSNSVFLCSSLVVIWWCQEDYSEAEGTGWFNRQNFPPMKKATWQGRSFQIGLSMFNGSAFRWAKQLHVTIASLVFRCWLRQAFFCQIFRNFYLQNHPFTLSSSEGVFSLKDLPRRRREVHRECSPGSFAFSWYWVH